MRQNGGAWTLQGAMLTKQAQDALGACWRASRYKRYGQTHHTVRTQRACGQGRAPLARGFGLDILMLLTIYNPLIDCF